MALKIFEAWLRSDVRKVPSRYNGVFTNVRYGVIGSGSGGGGSQSGLRVEVEVSGNAEYEATEATLVDTIVIEPVNNGVFSVGTSPGQSDVGQVTVQLGQPSALAIHYYLAAQQKLYFTMTPGQAQIKMYLQ
ncbi:MAG: hypothetical protein KatS3mg054_0057 [Chloroflexus sp.]|nr:MAG: hypothetical protein KatS3mg054_0057 [Chloroflexus sp.]